MRMAPARAPSQLTAPCGMRILPGRSTQPVGASRLAAHLQPTPPIDTRLLTNRDPARILRQRRAHLAALLQPLPRKQPTPHASDTEPEKRARRSARARGLSARRRGEVLGRKPERQAPGCGGSRTSERENQSQSAGMRRRSQSAGAARSSEPSNRAFWDQGARAGPGLQSRHVGASELPEHQITERYDRQRRRSGATKAPNTGAAGAGLPVPER